MDVNFFLQSLILLCALIALSIQQIHFNFQKTGSWLIAGTVFESFTNVTVSDCVRGCMTVEKCKSFSFDPVALLCNLHDISSSEAGAGDWTTGDTFIFSDIATLPTEMSGSCGSASCGANDRCIPSTPSVACLGYCGKPPATLNQATLVSDASKNFATATRVYECPSGYNMTPYGDDGLADIVCQNNGVWTTLEPSCVLI